mmetsp:Transcript_23306/g.37922  ORF Transcript_23306/g.37922 Transcript_23306/m.37922 type:complete len:106 (+) Transcript_23306:1289-1606(+)
MTAKTECSFRVLTRLARMGISNNEVAQSTMPLAVHRQSVAVAVGVPVEYAEVLSPHHQVGKILDLAEIEFPGLDPAPTMVIVVVKNSKYEGYRDHKIPRWLYSYE